LLSSLPQAGRCVRQCRKEKICVLLNHLTGSAIHVTSGSLAGDVAGWLCHSCNIWLAGWQCRWLALPFMQHLARWLARHSCNIWLALPFMQHLARWLAMLLAGSAIHVTSGSLAGDVAGWLAIHVTSGSLAVDVAGWLCHSCNIRLAGWLCHSCNIWLAGCRCRWLALPFMQHLARDACHGMGHVARHGV
jgi:hypothetical protein